LENLSRYIESLIFASEKSISVGDIKVALNTHFKKAKIKDSDIEASLEELDNKYKDEDFSFEIVCINKGYQFMTKGAYHPVIGQHLRLESKKKLSRAALETLAIISYKQPSTKSAIESVRGVNCDYSIQKLLEKELIEISGRAEGPGRPLLYATTEKFMNHLGIGDINELPKLKEFETDDENTIGAIDDHGNEMTDQNIEIVAPAVDMDQNEVIDLEQNEDSSVEEVNDQTISDSTPSDEEE